MARYLVTACNRGIGLGLVRELLKRGHFVFGTCRNPNGERDLWELEADYEERFKLLEMDVADEKSIQKACSQIDHIDVLINNAGVLEDIDKGLTELCFNHVHKAFTVNSVGPMMVSKYCLPALKKSREAKIFHIGSQLASIEQNDSGLAYAYRASKAALNMLNKNISIEYPDILSCVIHPGWVKTRMGGEKATLSIEDSVESICDTVQSLDLKDTGKFIDYRGQELSW